MDKTLDNLEERFDEKFEFSFNVGVVPDDMTKGKIIKFILTEKEMSYREGRESLMEEVEKMKKNEHGDTIMPNSYGLIVDTFHEKKVYNKALDDILSIISNKK